MTMNREDCHRTADLALATISQSSELPGWLVQMAWRTYQDMAWHLQYDYSLNNPGDRATQDMVWPRRYEIEHCRPALAALPDHVKAAHPADVLLAQELAKHVGLDGMSVSARLESLESLERTLARLRSYADEDAAGAVADDDAIEWAEDDCIEHSTNSGVLQHD
jgi:hypothetical protein